MPSLFARQNPFDEAKNTLSSWDNCMAKNYCKWPVIVGIVVGSLILLSVVACIARCICCGAECACCCFKCFTCCCSGSGRSGHRRVKSEPTPTYPTPYGAPPVNPYAQAHAAAPPPPIDARPVNQQYRSNAMPSFGVAPTPRPERPQFATFDSNRAVVNDDALPAMPTWKEGRDVHVEVEEQPPPKNREDVELDRLNRNGSVTNGSLAVSSAVPGARQPTRPTRSPASPTGDSYGFPPGYQNDSYAAHHDQPYARRAPGHSPAYDTYGQRDYYDEQVDRYQSPAPPPAKTNTNTKTHPYNSNTSPYADPYDEQVDRYQSPAPPPAKTNTNTNTYPYNSNSSPYADHYDEQVDRYQSPAPPPANTNTNTNTNTYNNSLPYPNPQRSYTPLSASERYEPSNASASSAAYPGQQTYTASPPAYPGQQSYQAFQPSGGVNRKAVDGSYREY